MTGPVMMPGMGELEPLEQGSASNLCGVYSCLNAVRLQIFPDRLDRAQLRHLFTFCVDQVEQGDGLLNAHVEGMFEHRRNGLLRRLVALLRREFGHPLKVRRTFAKDRSYRRPQALKVLREELEANKAVVLCLDGAYGHHTVLGGYGPNRFTLFDSDGFRWIENRSLGTSEDRVLRRHWFDTAGARSLSSD